MNPDSGTPSPEDAFNQISPRSGSGGRSEAEPLNLAAGGCGDDGQLEALLDTFPGSTLSFEDRPERVVEVESRWQGGRRPPATDTRLDLKTYLDRPEDRSFWVVKLRDYGDNLAEIGWCFIQDAKRLGRKKKRDKDDAVEKRKRSDLDPAHIERSTRRAKANVRRKVMASKADHLLSCTYRENELDFSKAWQDWGKFARKVRETLGEFRYAVVAERQKRGAIHFHAAVVGFQNVKMLRSLWRSVVGDGNIDVQAARTAKGHQWKRYRLASYLSKYMAKEFDEDGLEGRHRYRCSQGITIPSVTYYVPCSDAFHKIISILWSVTGSVAYIWEDPDTQRHGWACSWG